MLQLDTLNKLNGKMFLDNKKTQVLHKCFLVHMILFIKIYGHKKLEITFSFITSFFFANYFSIGLSIFISSSNFFAFNPWFAFKCFFKQLNHYFKNKTLYLSSTLSFGWKLQKTLDYYKISHNKSIVGYPYPILTYHQHKKMSNKTNLCLEVYN